MLTEAYAYQPLVSNDERHEIRILELEPAKKSEEPLRGSFVIASLNEPPKFEALSYVWGEPSFTRDIEIDRAKLPITQRLDNALRRFRNVDQTRLLWVDAICINQHDYIERGHQVFGMPEIYRKAQTTIAWLGDGDESTSWAIQKLVELAADSSPRSLRIMGTSTPAENISEPTAEAREVISAAGGLEVFYQNAWFTRLWIVQEAVLAASVKLYLRDAQLEWDVFESATNLIGSAARLTGQYPGWLIALRNAGDLISMRRDRKSYAPPEELPTNSEATTSFMQQLFAMSFEFERISRTQEVGQTDIVDRPLTFPILINGFRDEDFMKNIWSLRTRHCSNDRDRIYATRGFIPWDVPVKIMPDYSKTVPEVYTQFTREVLRSNLIEILQLAGLWRRNLADEDPQSFATDPTSCPSWVLELRTPRLASFVENVWDDHPLQPLKSLQGLRFTEHPAISFPEGATNWRRLCISGYTVDKLARVAKLDSLLHTMPLTQNLRFLFKLYCDKEFPGNGQYSFSVTQIEEHLEDFAEFIGFDSERDPADVARLFSLLYDGEAFMAHMAKVTEDLMVGDTAMNEQEAKFDSLVKFLLTRLCYRAFFSTVGGYRGFAPEMVLPGDDLVRFRGLSFPFILRKINGTEDFQLIGQCYVHDGFYDKVRVQSDEDYLRDEYPLVEFQSFSIL